jgi:hypothetical protein
LGVLLLLLASGTANAQWNPPNPATSAERRADGVVFRLKNGFLTLGMCSSIVRVKYARGASVSERADLKITKKR